MKGEYKNPNYMKEWRNSHKQEISEYNKKYRLEHLEEINERTKKYRSENKENIKEKQAERNKRFYSTPLGRAKAIIGTYKKKDKKYGRETTLTAEQLIHLWNNGCYWCGETDWHKLGADRIDNEKGHTLENCVCSCKSCNDKRGVKTFREFQESNAIIQHHLHL